MDLRVAYFVNQYPKVSHSFIRREVLALERQGLKILRIAARGWKGELEDREDWSERGRTRYLLQGGALPLLWALCRALLTRPGQFVSALSLALRMSRGAERPLPYHLVYLAEACRMLPWLEAFGATHVHAHFGTNSAEVVMLAHQLGGPKYSFTAHGSETVDGARFNGLGEKIRRSAFAVAVCSFGRSQLFRWAAQDDWLKIHVVHCGLEPAFHEVAPVPPPGQPRLVCVARLSKGKGQLLLLEAAHRLKQRNVPFELVFAGDGELRAEMEALIDRLELSECVRITGWVDSQRIRAEILAARGLVLPSFSEGLPVVIMEAMALRRPVLSTWVGGIPELVRSGKDGWLVPAGSVEELSAALEVFLTAPADELQAMGDAAHDRVLSRHSVDAAAAKLIELFQAPARPTIHA